MKKLILSSVFVLGAALAVSAQTTKSCDSEHGTKSCCKSSNTVSTGTNNTTNTTTTKSCCSQGGGSHHSSTKTTGTKGMNISSASAMLSTNKSTAVVSTEEPKK